MHRCENQYSLLTLASARSQQVHEEVPFLPRKPGVYAYAARWLIRICAMVTAHTDILLCSEWCGDCILMLRY